MRKILFALLLFVAVDAYAKIDIVGSFEDVNFKFPVLRVDKEHIFIVDNARRFGVICDKTNLKKIIHFGGPGEGPGEFGAIANFAVDERFIYVSGFPRLSIFSKDGKFVKELKARTNVSGLMPMGENFVGNRARREYYDRECTHMIVDFSLYDSLLGKKKKLMDSKLPAYYMPRRKGKHIVNWIRDCIGAVVYKDRVYVGTTEKGFNFHVFDGDGNKLYEINRDEPRIAVTSEYKKKTLDGLRKVYGKEKWQEYIATKEIRFVDYFPAYKSFFVNDDRIYVFSQPMNGKYELTILDLKGNLLSKREFSQLIIGNVDSKLNYIENGKYYRLSDINERWMLFAITIWDK